ncbi:hypothetical protein D3C81_1032690 [compost metagenome]
MDALWTSAKHIAQADGRKDDWIYVIDVYKSIGGNSLALMIFSPEGRHEVLGEVGVDNVLIHHSSGELQVIEKSVYTKSVKKFLKKQASGNKLIEKALTYKGNDYKASIDVGAKFN